MKKEGMNNGAMNNNAGNSNVGGNNMGIEEKMLLSGSEGGGRNGMNDSELLNNAGLGTEDITAMLKQLGMSDNDLSGLQSNFTSPRI